MFFSRLLKQILIPAILLSVYFPARAQEFYLRGGAANNFGIGGMTVYKIGGRVNEFSEQISYESVKLNLGEGLVLNAAGGVIFKKYFGAELGLGYLKGKSHKIESRIFHSQYSITESIDETFKAPMFLIQPSLIVRTGGKTFIPYARVGAVWAFGNISQKIDHKLWTQKIATESQYTGSGFGLQGGIGVDFKANEEITFYTEVTFSNLTYTPEKWELTKATENEQPFLYTLPKNEREKVFVKTYIATYDQNGQLVEDPDMPGQIPQEHYPLNSIGLGAGIKYTF